MLRSWDSPDTDRVCLPWCPPAPSAGPQDIVPGHCPYSHGNEGRGKLRILGGATVVPSPRPLPLLMFSSIHCMERKWQNTIIELVALASERIFQVGC